MNDQNSNPEQGSSKALAPQSETATEGKFGGNLVHQRAETAAIQVAKEAEAQVNARFIMAIKHPRNEDQAAMKIVNTCKNLLFAEKSIYKKPVGKKQVGGKWVQNYIEGPSIRFAEEMARHWKNFYINSSAVYEDETKRIVRVMVLDLEANLDYDKTITIEKTVERKSAKGREVIEERLNSYGERVFIVKTTDDELINKENALASKAIRNGILRCIPEHILAQAMKEARKTLKEGVNRDPAGAKREVMSNLANLNILPKDIEEYLGHALDHVTSDEIADLKVIFLSIKDGQTTWKEIIGGKIEDAETTGPETAQMGDGVGEEGDGFYKSDAKASKVTDPVGKGEQE